MQSSALQGYWSAYSARLCPFSVKTNFPYPSMQNFVLQGYHIAYSARLCPFSVKTNFPYPSMQNFVLQGYYITPPIKTQHTFDVKTKIRALRRK